MRWNIGSEFETIEGSRLEIGRLAFMSREHKKTREWYVLGAVQKLLAASGLDHPVFAQEKEPPDFLTFRDDHTVWSPVEVTEVLPPGYRRHDYYRGRATKAFDRLKEPFQPLRAGIRKKARKRDDSTTTLLAYFNIGRLRFDDWLTPFHTQLLTEHERNRFEGSDVFERVLVISSDFESLVELFPKWQVIKPDKAL